jgi:hypothetical protein
MFVDPSLFLTRKALVSDEASLEAPHQYIVIAAFQGHSSHELLIHIFQRFSSPAHALAAIALMK